MERKHIVCLMTACILLLSLLASCTVTPKDPALPELTDVPSISNNSITFENGNHLFMRMLEQQAGADISSLTSIEYGDGNAVQLTPAGTGVPYLAIDVNSLLGEAVSRLNIIELTIGLDHKDDEFFAVSGDITLFSGIGNLIARDNWSVYLAAKNPNIARLVLNPNLDKPDPKVFNYLVLARKTDNALLSGKNPSNLLISSIAFFDETGAPLSVNPDANFDAPPGFDEPDRTNLIDVDNEQTLQGVSGESSGWGQAIALPTLKNQGSFDPALLAPGSVISVSYESANPPEVIVQSWTEDAPGSAGWAKVAPAAVNDSGSTAQFIYADIVSAFGTDDFATYLDQLYIGDTGEHIRVNSVSIGTAK